MSHAYDTYIAKKAAYEQATDTVNRVIDELKKFATPLITNWRNCYIEMFGEATPMEMLSGRQKVDGSNVPPVADIRRALLIQFNAQKEANQAWTALSEQERKELKLPPWLQR